MDEKGNVMSFEYKVVPAPVRGLKAKGVKTPEDRFAHALETEMNTLAADGWEYLRADTLPCEQRDGLMSKTTVFQNVLIFRREQDASMANAAPKSEPQLQKSVPVVAAPAATTEPDNEPVSIADAEVVLTGEQTEKPASESKT